MKPDFSFFTKKSARNKIFLKPTKKVYVSISKINKYIVQHKAQSFFYGLMTVQIGKVLDQHQGIIYQIAKILILFV
jgi:ribosomal protein L18E